MAYLATCLENQTESLRAALFSLPVRVAGNERGGLSKPKRHGYIQGWSFRVGSVGGRALERFSRRTVDLGRQKCPYPGAGDGRVDDHGWNRSYPAFWIIQAAYPVLARMWC